jgi:hypothetical protein
MKDLEALINTGERPSKLELGQLHTGELQGSQADRVQRQVQQQGSAREHLEALGRERVPAFDPEILRKRAFRIQEDEQREAERAAQAAPARPATSWWRQVLPVTAAVAAATVALLTLLPPPGQPLTRERHVTPMLTSGAKGSGGIEFYLLRNDEVHPGSEEELHWAGDRVQFSYRTEGESSLVLLSLDGRGELNLYYPASGDQPVAVVPGERRMLEGSIILDDAPEFELILAYFGHASVELVRDEVRAIYHEEGREGLLLLAEDYPDVDAIFLRKGERAPDAGSP